MAAEQEDISCASSQNQTENKTKEGTGHLKEMEDYLKHMLLTKDVGKNPPRLVGEVRLLKGLVVHKNRGPRQQGGCGSFPLKGEKQGTQDGLPNTECQCQNQETTQHPVVKGHRVCLCWETRNPLGTKALCFFSFLILKGAKAQDLCSQPLALSPSKGKVDCSLMRRVQCERPRRAV